MSSQITHYIFARELLQRVFARRKELSCLEGNGGVIAFFSQGPDIFYHNQRTQPSAFKYGRILHRGGYGDVIKNIAREIIERKDEMSPPGRCSSLLVALFAFASHALLDRVVHPFIVSFSGWREPGNRETRRFFRMHAFFERILDLLAVRELLSEDPLGFDFYGLMDSPDFRKELKGLMPLFLRGIRGAYPNLNKPDLDEERFENALKDALFFYKVTNPPDDEMLLGAYHRDREHGFQRLVLALYYPRILREAEYDFANRERLPWPDPFTPGFERRESFWDLYERALEEGTEVISSVLRIMTEGGDISDISSLVGNGNLSNGEQEKSPAPRSSSPLPLYELLEEQYRHLEKKYNLDEAFIHEKPV